MSQTDHRDTGDQQDATTRRLRRRAELVGVALKHSPDEVRPETAALLAALERDSIELDGFDGIDEDVLEELCKSLGLVDFQVEAVLRAGAGLIGVFAPHWTVAPPAPILALGPDGFHPSQIVALAGRRRQFASALAFMVEFLYVDDLGSSTGKTIRLVSVLRRSRLGCPSTRRWRTMTRLPATGGG